LRKRGSFFIRAEWGILINGKYELEILMKKNLRSKDDLVFDVSQDVRSFLK